MSIEKYQQIDFNKMDNIFRKAFPMNNKVTDGTFQSNLTYEENNYIDFIYKTLKEEIEFHNKNNSFKKESNPRLKTMRAWETLLYIRDNRSIEQLIKNVEKNWKFEDHLVKRLTEEGFNVELSGNDKDRVHTIFSFNSNPDLTINGIPVEVQRGKNKFFKENKLKNCISKNAYILYYHDGMNKFHLFNPNELREIFHQPVDTMYGNYKKGRIFDDSKYLFSEFKESLNSLKKPFNNTINPNTTVNNPQNLF